jgi:hypothetical protein
MRMGDRWWWHAIALVMAAGFVVSHDAVWARILGGAVILGTGWGLASRVRRGFRSDSPGPPPYSQPAYSQPVEVDALDGGEWIFSVSPSEGTTEVELRVRDRRYLASFAEAEGAAFRAAATRLSAELDGGRSRVDVNAPFEQEMGRKPFADGGPVRRSLLRRATRRT